MQAPAPLPRNRRCRRRAGAPSLAVAALALALWVLATPGCARRAIAADDAAWLKRRPDVHPQVGPPVRGELRFIAAGARGRPDQQLVSAALAKGLTREALLPQVSDRSWRRDPLPGRTGPLLDPADVLVSRFLEVMRARGLAGPRTAACRRGECEPELLLDAVIDRLEISLADAPVRPHLPVFHGAVTITDAFGRVLWRGACELSIAARLGGRPEPVVPALQRALDAAALECAERLAGDLFLAVEGRPARRERTYEDW